ncbi:MAG TPA: hypothetical protein VGS98_04110 [Thermoanaerobaculia bacterium]|nr:hypothetical protein [Thermoanaerobaculia bacterium]
MAPRLLSQDAVENRSRRPDLFDRLLSWIHRLLNPPPPAPAQADRRPPRVRDRVPI